MKKFILILCVISVSFYTFATEDTDKSNSYGFTSFFESDYFKLDPVADSIIIGTGATLFGTSIILDKALNPVDTSKAYNKYDINDVNGFDRAFMLPYSKTQDTLGNVAVVAAALTPALLLTAPHNEWGTMATMYGESILLSWGIKEVIKNSVNRLRPYMYIDGAPSSDIDNGKFSKSFPSGHTTIAFTSAAFTSYVFSTYYPDSAWKIPVISLSYALAAATATFRVTAGDHFVTDVLTGAAIGTISGFLVPWIHSKIHINSILNDDKKNLSLNISSSCISVTLKTL